MINMTLSYNPTNKMATTDFKRFAKDYSFDDMGIVLKMDGRYSPFIFNNNYRKSENYIQNISNCIILDFDDGYSRSQFKNDFNFAYAAGTTKSHMIDKNGNTGERFRVIIPTNTSIDLNSEEYTNMMVEILVEFDGADKACKDTARAYSGFSGAEVEIVHGDLFCWLKYHNKAIKRKELRQWQQNEKSKPQIQNDGTKADWYRENWLNDMMRSKLGIDEKFVSGNRNQTIYSVARYLKDIELLDVEIVEAIEWINNGELGEFEIKQVMKGLRILV